jgi:hypothetical protein
MRPSFLLSAVLLSAACSSPVSKSDQSGDSAQLDEASDAADLVASNIKIYGPITYGSENVRADYTGTPRYVGFSFNAEAGDVVSPSVSLMNEPFFSNKKPILWILDDQWQLVARSVDDPQVGGYAAMNTNITTTGSYYVVIREASLLSTTFAVDMGSNRTAALVTTGCPGTWTDGLPAGRVRNDYDYSTIAGSYTRTAVADMVLPANSTQTLPAPIPMINAVELRADLSYDATIQQLDSNGKLEDANDPSSFIAETGTYQAINNLMLGPQLDFSPAGVTTLTLDNWKSILGLDRGSDGTINRICLIQRGQYFTLARNL